VSGERGQAQNEASGRAALRTRRGRREHRAGDRQGHHRSCTGGGPSAWPEPLTVVVLDAGGHVVSAERQDGASNNRFEIAYGKAYGAIALGMGSRSLMARAEQQPYFISAAAAAIGGWLVPVPVACSSRMRRGRCSAALASPATRPTTTNSPRSPGSRPLPWYRSKSDRQRVPKFPVVAVLHRTARFIA
jgi:hypothetical protein